MELNAGINQVKSTPGVRELEMDFVGQEGTLPFRSNFQNLAG